MSQNRKTTGNTRSPIVSSRIITPLGGKHQYRPLLQAESMRIYFSPGQTTALKTHGKGYISLQGRKEVRNMTSFNAQSDLPLKTAVGESIGKTVVNNITSFPVIFILYVIVDYGSKDIIHHYFKKDESLTHVWSPYYFPGRITASLHIHESTSQAMAVSREMLWLSLISG